MKEQLISLETAKLAKEKGFNLNSHAFYGCDFPSSSKPNQLILRSWEKWENFGKEDSQEGTYIYSAPTQSLLQKWLRDIHRIDVHCECNYERDLWTFGYRKKGYNYNHYPLEYNTYEEALEVGLQEALKLIK